MVTVSFDKFISVQDRFHWPSLWEKPFVPWYPIPRLFPFLCIQIPFSLCSVFFVFSRTLFDRTRGLTFYDTALLVSRTQRILFKRDSRHTRGPTKINVSLPPVDTYIQRITCRLFSLWKMREISSIIWIFYYLSILANSISLSNGRVTQQCSAFTVMNKKIHRLIKKTTSEFVFHERNTSRSIDLFRNFVGKQ